MCEACAADSTFASGVKDSLLQNYGILDPHYRRPRGTVRHHYEGCKSSRGVVSLSSEGCMNSTTDYYTVRRTEGEGGDESFPSRLCTWSNYLAIYLVKLQCTMSFRRRYAPLYHHRCTAHPAAPDTDTRYTTPSPHSALSYHRRYPSTTRHACREPPTYPAFRRAPREP